MLYTRLTRVPDRSFFLFGPRGVGKSTWARSALPDALRLDLLDEALFIDLLGDPSLFRDLVSGHRRDEWVVIDEVQRIPGLLNEVHRLIEERGVRFALLGSSARKLKTAGSNLLAGRAIHMEMYPLTAAELGEDFNLDDALRYGTIPLVWAANDRREVLGSYTHLYLREEIRAEAAVRNLSGFVRFLPLAALMHAQTVNSASLARDAGIARSTVSGYLEILEDTLLITRLSGVRGQASSARTASPEALLGRPWLGAGREASTRTGYRRGAWRVAGRMGLRRHSGTCRAPTACMTTLHTGRPSSLAPRLISYSPETTRAWLSRSRRRPATTPLCSKASGP